MLASPYSLRIRQVRKRLTTWKADGLLITNPKDIRYLCGFHGDDSWGLLTAGSPRFHILSDFRFQEEIQHQAPQAKAHIRKLGLADELAQLAQSLSLHRLAIQPDYLTIQQQQVLRKRASKLRWLTVDDGLLEQRSVKDPGEISLVQKALAIQQNAFEQLRKELTVGQTERQIAARLDYLMRSLGADGPSFPTIVAIDANASLPHAIPGNKKLGRRSAILIDWGARYQGYCSDLTRVIFMGPAPARIKEIYRIVLDAQQAAIAAIAPGKTVKEIDQVARQIIRDAGFGEKFGHGLGHGIGLDIHELPALSFRSDARLQAGQIVTVEPGIYLPGVGGVRIEDDVLLTPQGNRVLSRLPVDLNWACG